MCRTEVQSWTTKRLVQLTLDPQKQQELPLDEQRQQEEISQIPNKKETGTSNEMFFELCRFDSSDNFRNCLKGLNAVKAELSLFEFLLIMRANLFIFPCRDHSNEFIKMFKASDIILALEVIEETIRYMVVEVQSGRMQFPSHGQTHNYMPLRCFWDLQLEVEMMMDVSVRAFPTNRKVILKQKNKVLKMLDEMDNFFTCDQRPLSHLKSQFTVNSVPSVISNSVPGDASSSVLGVISSSVPSDASNSMTIALSSSVPSDSLSSGSSDSSSFVPSDSSRPYDALNSGPSDTLSSGTRDALNSERSDTSSSGPNDTASSCPSGTLRSGPGDALSSWHSDTLSSGPSYTLSSGPSDTLSSGLSDTFSSGPSDILSSGPSDTLSYGPNDHLSSGPSDSLSSGPSDHLSSGPSDTLSSVPSDTLSSGPSDTWSSGPSDT